MSSCLCRPTYQVACVEMNWRPRAHVYMMGLPRRYLTADRLLVDALAANGLVGRMGVRVVPTALGAKLFMQQYRFCSPLAYYCIANVRRGLFSVLCDGRPSVWRPDPGSVSFRNPCTI